MFLIYDIVKIFFCFLFLDEFMEFKTECIEALRQPLEDGTIDITRNGIYHQFPADFQLIATMNPCPCGYGLEDGICRCTYHEKKRYLKKLSGPILDRFDPFFDLTGRFYHFFLFRFL